jgi:hypothetical protein
MFGSFFSRFSTGEQTSERSVLCIVTYCHSIFVLLFTYFIFIIQSFRSFFQFSFLTPKIFVPSSKSSPSQVMFTQHRLMLAMYFFLCDHFFVICCLEVRCPSVEITKQEVGETLTVTLARSYLKCGECCMEHFLWSEIMTAMKQLQHACQPWMSGFFLSSRNFVATGVNSRFTSATLLRLQTSWCSGELGEILHAVAYLCFVDRASRYMRVIKSTRCTIYLQFIQSL